MLFQYCCTVADFFTADCLCVNLMHVVICLETDLHIGKKLYLYQFTELDFCKLGPSWSPGH